jgi:hypothetical protein
MISCAKNGQSAIGCVAPWTAARQNEPVPMEYNHPMDERKQTTNRLLTQPQLTLFGARPAQV